MFAQGGQRTSAVKCVKSPSFFGIFDQKESALLYFREDNEVAATAASAFGGCYRRS